MNLWYYLLIIVSTTLLAIGLTLLTRKLATHFKVLDIPGGRHIHKSPTPKWGGIAIFTVIILAILFLLIFFPYLTRFSGFLIGGFIDKRLLAVVVGGFILVAIGAIDDKITLPPIIKLFWQVIAALIIIASGIGIDFIRNPFGADIQLNTINISINFFGNQIHYISLWGDLIVLIWIVGMINVMNFLDGLDGLAGGVTFIALITLFILSLRTDVNQVVTAVFCLISAGAVLGFLTQNFNPAKIFMGDSGSMLLGYLLAVLAIISGGKVATAFLALGFPILDGLWVFFRRIIEGHSPFIADKKHLHHRLLALGLSQKSTVVIIYILTALFGAIALLTTTQEKMIALVWLLVLMVVLAVTLVVLEHKKEVKS